jgi:hypothetical protein
VKKTHRNNPTTGGDSNDKSKKKSDDNSEHQKKSDEQTPSEEAMNVMAVTDGTGGLINEGSDINVEIAHQLLMQGFETEGDNSADDEDEEFTLFHITDESSYQDRFTDVNRDWFSFVNGWVRARRSHIRVGRAQKHGILFSAFGMFMPCIDEERREPKVICRSWIHFLDLWDVEQCEECSFTTVLNRMAHKKDCLWIDSCPSRFGCL